MASILNQYCFASGQSINLNNSEIFFSMGCPHNLKSNLASELRVLVIEKTRKYLGVPSDSGQTKKNNVCADTGEGKYDDRGLEGEVSI